tara:strand:- start:566 stop:838 length:273 start_codon:yes stop_codon:yes gene_type:complete
MTGSDFILYLIFPIFFIFGVIPLMGGTFLAIVFYIGKGIVKSAEAFEKFEKKTYSKYKIYHYKGYIDYALCYIAGLIFIGLWIVLVRLTQ